MRKKLFLISLSLFMMAQSMMYADEGMWLLTMLNKTYADMKKQGLKLTPEDIYSINKASLKDAVIIFGGGCTGEMVSPQGLVLTNHHCGYGSMQALSSVGHDYLADGYWAKSRAEELPCPGLAVTFLVKLEDVTAKVNAVLNDKMTEKERNEAIQKVSQKIAEEATKNTAFIGSVRPLFGGNNFYLFIYQQYRDVRFVGAPPSSIGNFGGETDNWEWPRQTCDFSVFRVYMSKDGKPAEYSKDNVPYVPKHYLPVSLKGVKKDDYAMIMGYPGRTQRYMTSWEMDEVVNITDPNRVKIRNIKLDLMMEDMKANEKVNIQYASKWKGSANYYKYAKGEIQQLNNLKVGDIKRAEEAKFTAWVKADPKRNAKYGDALNLISSSIEGRKDLVYANSYFSEALFQGIEIFNIARYAGMLDRALQGYNPSDTASERKVQAAISRLKERAEGFYKDYNPPTDKKITTAMLKLFAANVDKKFQPALFDEIQTKYQGNIDKYVDDLFSHSIFADQQKMEAFLKSPSSDVLSKDPAVTGSQSVMTKMNEIRMQSEKFDDNLAEGQRLYIAGLEEMQPNKLFYPDANFTMRLTYGKVEPYQPRDGVLYYETTTLKGVIQKSNSDNPDYVAPEKLKQMYYAKDYGRYGKNGIMTTCFLTNNDITGGNSGSPVINANGELIGLAFDGNWEAMSGNISFDPQLQRTICVDIRYVLFIIDKYSGAKNIVNEMKLVENVQPKK